MATAWIRETPGNPGGTCRAAVTPAPTPQEGGQAAGGRYPSAPIPFEITRKVSLTHRPREPKSAQPHPEPGPRRARHQRSSWGHHPASLQSSARVQALAPWRGSHGVQRALEPCVLSPLPSRGRSQVSEACRQGQVRLLVTGSPQELFSPGPAGSWLSPRRGAQGSPLPGSPAVTS